MGRMLWSNAACGEGGGGGGVGGGGEIDCILF